MDQKSVEYLARKMGKLNLKETLFIANNFRWQWFGELWGWATEQTWWDTFLVDNGRYNDNFEMFINETLINPEVLTNVVANFLQKH